MVVEVVALRERFTTHPTLVWLFACMNAFMVIEVTTLCKVLATVNTAVGSQSCVCAFMLS